jgi:hypothetical protein
LPEKGEKYEIGITQLEFFVDDFLYPVFAKSRFRFICFAQSHFLHNVRREIRKHRSNWMRKAVVMKNHCFIG